MMAVPVLLDILAVYLDQQFAASVFSLTFWAAFIVMPFLF